MNLVILVIFAIMLVLGSMANVLTGDNAATTEKKTKKRRFYVFQDYNAAQLNMARKFHATAPDNIVYCIVTLILSAGKELSVATVTGLYDTLKTALVDDDKIYTALESKVKALRELNPLTDTDGARILYANGSPAINPLTGEGKLLDALAQIDREISRKNRQIAAADLLADLIPVAEKIEPTENTAPIEPTENTAPKKSSKRGNK